MPDSTGAKFTFLPFVRQGLAAAVSARRTAQADPDGRLALPVRLRVNTSRDGAATDAPDDIAVPLKLYGPGDIAGIDQREIVRTEPRNLTADFEPNYFPAIEFDRPDFPWMFTPAHADAARHPGRHPGSLRSPSARRRSSGGASRTPSPDSVPADSQRCV